MSSGFKKTPFGVVSKLEHTLNALSQVEKRHFRSMLEAPYFNTRTDVLRLYDWLCAHALDPREVTFAQVYADAPYDAQKLRLVMSYLQQQAEQYLAYLEWRSTSGAYETDLVRAIRKRSLETHFAEALRTAKSVLQRQPLRHTDYYIQWGKLLWEEARFESVRDPGAVRYLERLSDHADLAWATQKLRYLCLHQAQQIVYQSDHALRFRDKVEQMVMQSGWEETPAVAVWYYCLKMLEQPESVDFFNLFKGVLLAEDIQFDGEEVRDLHLFAVNYCIRRVNEGHRVFFNDIMDFYKAGLRKGYLLDKGQLSRFTYHNIVAAALQTLEYDWAEDFLHRYKNSLERSHRESSFSFNLARLEFARKRYEAVLPLLQNSNYHDPLLSLSAKAMSLKIYYETREYDLLHSHLEAMKNYIRRKSTIGYHRVYYLNLVRYTQRLTMLNWTDKKQVEQLRHRIAQETILIEREWLLEQLG